jgi:hypothetical protein
MNSGAGLGGRTPTTTGGGGAPILIPMEMSAPNTDALASSITTINVVLMKLFILS